MQSAAKARYGLTVLFAAGLVVLLPNRPAPARTWSGQVVDARTGQPMKGVGVIAGSAGSVGLGFEGDSVATGADGRFRITFPEDYWKRVEESTRKGGWDSGHWLRVYAPETWREIGGTGYWQAAVVRRTPGEVVVRLMPRQTYFRGRVLSAEDNKPLAKVRVTLGGRKPGETDAPFSNWAGQYNGLTDEEGNFVLTRPGPGFPSEGFGYPSMWHDVEEGLDAGNVLRDYGPMWEFAVTVDGGATWHPIPRERIVTSADERIHTYVVIRHPAKDKPPHATPVTAEIRGLPDKPPAIAAPAPAQPEAPATPVDISGTWRHTPTGDTWTFTHLGDGRYTAVQKGFENQPNTAVVTGNKVNVMGPGGTVGDLEVTIAPDGRSGSTTAKDAQGKVTDTRDWVRIDGPPAAPTPPAARMTLRADSRKAKTGETVTVPVWLLQGKGLIDLNFNVEYDPAVVQPVGSVVRGNLLPGADFEANTAKRGVVQLGLVPKAGGVGAADGTLAQVSFRAVGKPGTRTTLRIVPRKGTVAGGAAANPATIHGEIQIVGDDGFIPGDISGDGKTDMADVLMALKISVELLPHNPRADVDGDGQVTAADARLIREMVLGRR